MYHHHSQQEEPPQPFSNRPSLFNHQDQAHQQQQQQHHSHFQYPPIKGSRDTDMERMNMNVGMDLERIKGSGFGSFSSSPQPLSESQPGHQRVVLERVVLDWSNYQHPGQTFSSPPSTVTQLPQSSNSAMGMQAWMHEPPSPQTRGSHSGGVDGQGVRERAGSILASLGLSSQVLEVLSQYPEDHLTPDKLPHILQAMLSRKSNDQNIAASSSSSSYSQSATHTARETLPPPSCSQRSSGRLPYPEVSSLRSVAQTAVKCIDYGDSSPAPGVSSSREAFIREPPSYESLTAAEPLSYESLRREKTRKRREQRKRQMARSSEFHKSKRLPTAECLLPPRSRHPDPDYRRDSPKRSPSSEIQSDYSSSSRCPAPWSSLSKPRDDTKRLPTPSMICDYSAESKAMLSWKSNDQNIAASSSSSYSQSATHTACETLPPPSSSQRSSGRLPYPEVSSVRSVAQTAVKCIDYGPAAGVSSREAFMRERPSYESLTAAELLSFESLSDAERRREKTRNRREQRKRQMARSGEFHKSKRLPTAECLLPPRSRHPDPDYRRDSPKRSPSSETQSDYSSSSRRPAPWSSLSKPRDDTKRLPTPSMICDYSAESKESPDIRKDSHTVPTAEEEDCPEIFYSNGTFMGYHCKLCDITVSTVNGAELDDHLRGRKHNVLLIKSKSLRSLYLAKNRDNLEDICRAESIVVVHKNPLTVSYCELCKYGTEPGVFEHLISKVHIASLWNKIKRSTGKDQTAPRFSAHLEERHLQELYLEIEANCGERNETNEEGRWKLRDGNERKIRNGNHTVPPIVKRLMSEDKRREEDPMQKKQKTQAATAADNPPPPFDPNSADDAPAGMEFLVPKTGFFCQVCNSFFSVEATPLVPLLQRNHCKSVEHNTNLQKYLQSRKTSS